MRRTKMGILVTLVILAVGFAAVSTNLIINGTAIFGTNMDDFDVIFTKAIIDDIDVSSTAISEDGKTLTFETSELVIKDEESILDFTVKNNSSQYDANVTMECVAEGENASEHYEITNTIPNVIEAKTSKEGTVTARLKKSSVEEIHETFICTITATAIERDTLGEDIPQITWNWTDSNNSTTVDVGDIITYGTESFNVTSTTEDTITMLAAYNLGTDYRQSTTENRVTFSDTKGWEYTPGPKEIDIQSYNGNVKTYVNEYVSYLQSKTGDTSITGNLITLNELKELGCIIQDNYSYTEIETCANSNNVSWLANGQQWWTRSAYSEIADVVWIVNDDGSLYNIYYIGYGVRPVITISTELIDAPVCTFENPTTICNEDDTACWIDSDCSATKNIGDVIMLGSETNTNKEQFYILSIDETNTKMITMYNLEVGNSTNSAYPVVTETGFQSVRALGNKVGETTYGTVAFSNSSNTGTNLSDYKGSIVEAYVNNYGKYLINSLGVQNTTTLISIEELDLLGCESSSRSCREAPKFLYNTSYWTKSAYSNIYIWAVLSSGGVGENGYNNNSYFGVRPVVTIATSVLN